MVVKKKVEETITPTGVVDSEVNIEVNDAGEETINTPTSVDVELTEQYKGITSIISKGIIEFVDNKAQVSAETAALLREQGIVE